MTVSRRKGADFDRDVAAYTLAEAARYVRLPAATLRSWVLGRQYPTADGRGDFPPLIRPASKEPAWLSFSNLIEAHVLRSLRTEHGVPVKALRNALAYAQKKLGIDRLLLRPELRAEPGKVFLDRYGELIELTASGQLAMRRLFEEQRSFYTRETAAAEKLLATGESKPDAALPRPEFAATTMLVSAIMNFDEFVMER